MDAASKGAASGIPIVLGIIANIVAFVSFIALVNGLLGWLGILVGFEDLSFEVSEATRRFSSRNILLGSILGDPRDSLSRIQLAVWCF